MKLVFEHDWDVSPKEARAIQQRLRTQVVVHDDIGTITRIAGVDVGFEEHGKVTRAAVAVLDGETLACCEHAIARRPTGFPYVPGLLSFREIPAVLEALALLSQPPDLLLCDGQGLAHPRRFGIACHLGVLTGIPAIGVAKSRLTGTHAEVPDVRGAWVPLCAGDEVIGAVLRTRVKVKPVFVSIGHRVCLETAVAQVMRCVTRYRLPETTRLADRLASRRGTVPVGFDCRGTSR